MKLPEVVRCMMMVLKARVAAVTGRGCGCTLSEVSCWVYCAAGFTTEYNP